MVVDHQEPHLPGSRGGLEQVAEPAGGHALGSEAAQPIVPIGLEVQEIHAVGPGLDLGLRYVDRRPAAAGPALGIPLGDDPPHGHPPARPLGEQVEGPQRLVDRGVRRLGSRRPAAVGARVDEILDAVAIAVAGHGIGEQAPFGPIRQPVLVAVALDLGQPEEHRRRGDDVPAVHPVGAGPAELDDVALRQRALELQVDVAKLVAR